MTNCVINDVKCYIVALGLNTPNTQIITGTTTPNTQIITGTTMDEIERQLRSEYRLVRDKVSAKTFNHWKQGMLAEEKLAYYELYSVGGQTAFKWKPLNPEETAR